MDIPVVRLEPDTPNGARRLQPSETSGATIFVGAKALARTGVSLETIGGAGLKAGEGLVSAFTLAGRPAVAVVGDDGGISSAAVMLAGHLPFIWDQKSVTTDKVAVRCEGVLVRERRHAQRSAVASSVLVRDQIDGAERLVVEAQMASGGDLVKAQVALLQLKATGSRDPKRALSYANVRTVRIRLRAPGSGGATIDLPAIPAATRCRFAAARAAARRRREGKLRSVLVLRQRRRAGRLRQQPDSRSRRRAAQRRRRRRGRRGRSGSAPRSRIDRRVACRLRNRRRRSSRPTASRSSS